ncbi:MAG: tyrosine-type recombinase/integrase [Methylococcaceae bacterium]
MALSDTSCRSAHKHAKATANKPFKLPDEKGLYLLVTPKVDGWGKWWRFKYRISGKEKSLSFGIYPDVGLQQARERRDEARKLLAQGIDPGEHRKAKKQAILTSATNTFEAVAREWHAKFRAKWTDGHANRLLTRLEQDVFPYIGNRAIEQIDALDLLDIAKRMEARGVIETTHRIIQNCGQIFRYGVVTRRCKHDPSASLRGALIPIKSKHHASITDPKKIGELMRAIDDYQGSFTSRCGLKFSALTFCRPGEIRHAEWQEIDWQEKQWRLPAEKMKMRQPHIVPLSRQALELLSELQQATGNGKYLFPSERTPGRPMSENTANAALRRMGYSKEEMTAHGFRSMASTRLNELHFNKDHIERQLAHSEQNDVRKAYNYAEYLPARTEMMQAWADYLDALKAGSQVTPFRWG